MAWTSFGQFIHMGGYGLYVWGSYGVTLALQSVNDTTLEHIKRANISSDHYRELQRRFAADGVYTYTDLILGLPGESYAKFASGVSRVIADGQHNHIQFHNCSVLPNAEMGDPGTETGYRGLASQDAYLMLADAKDMPDTLITVGLNDKRVAPWFAAKFAARASQRFAGRRLVLVRADAEAGHGVGSARDLQIAEFADTLAFLRDRTGR